MRETSVEVRVHGDGERLVVEIVGEVDLSNADAVQRQLADASSAAGERMLVIDLSRLRYVDSRGIGLLYELAGRRGSAPLVLVAPADSPVGHLLDVTHMADVVPVVPTAPA